MLQCYNSIFLVELSAIIVITIIIESKEVIDECIDEERWAPPPLTYDLVIGNMNLHWINDLQGIASLKTASSLRRMLQRDAIFAVKWLLFG